jgi:probable H4MPT-linked C1 transfer pathway protein
MNGAGGAVLGWDVGGANVKAALVAADIGAQPVVVERPFALWREPGRLPAVLAEIAGGLGGARRMAVTMTAELADCYATKREGVASVLDAFQAAFPDVKPRVFGVDGRFRSTQAARGQPLRVAAANWMASATLVAEAVSDALFLDAGSTTTDVIPIVGGRVTPRGRSDLARLRSGELVYTGALRTPVCGIVRSLPVHGRRCRVAAELFAISADAHLWLGLIGEREYTCETPDGRGRSRREAGARLARMVSADAERLGDAALTAIAEHVTRAQVRQIASGIAQVKRRLGARCPRLAVLAGLGSFLTQSAAEATGLTTCTLDARLGPAAARALPAAAVAILLAREREA